MMKINLKTYLIHILCGRAFVLINTVIQLVAQILDESTESSLFFFVALILMAIGYFGLFLLQVKQERYLSKKECIIEYFGALIYSIVLICVFIIDANWTGAIVLIGAVLAEAAVVPIISYRYRIFNKLKTFLKKKK